MHYHTQQTHMESPIHHHRQEQQTTPKDNYVVDERWDGDFFITEQQIIKGHQPVEDLFKNLTLSTNTTTSEISPPLSSPLKCDQQQLFTSCFREDIDEANYFSEPEEDKQDSNPNFIHYIDTPSTMPPVTSVYEVVEEEQDCDYLTSFAALKDNKQQKRTQPLVRKRNEEEEEDDLLIESVADQTHENEQTMTGPVSFEYYHASLVQHYKSILFTLSNDEAFDNSTLPPIYKQYIVDLKQHMYSLLPSTM